MKKSLSLLSIAVGICSAMGGCNVGMAPSGGSEAEIKAAFDKQPLEERAKSILGSPASIEFKTQRIKEMYDKEGKEVPPDLLPTGAGTSH